MRKTLSAFCLALSALCLFSLFGLSARAQDRDRDRDNDRAEGHPNGIVHDWSSRHLVYPRFGSIESLIRVQHDPRAILSWQAAEREDWHRARHPRHFRNVDEGFHRDWAISLGGGSTAPAMYPAKYGFDPNATALCTDFVVFPVNIAGSLTQPNLVAFSNLYSGGTALVPTGQCGSRTPATGDNDSSATTLWSYDINAAGGVVATSPALSVDGTKVAFVESVAGTSAHFHVLAWKSGDGVDITTPNAQNVLLPKQISSFTGLLAPVAGSGTASDLSLGATGDTLSSPFVDFTDDVAYVGNDAGVLFRVKNVFCPHSSCAGAAPSLDTTWNLTGSVTIGGTCTGVLGKLTGAVVDSNTGNVFVGCADGHLYGFTSAGAVLAPSIALGDATATGGIVDPPMIDPVNKLVYVVTGSNGGGASVLLQASTTNLGSVRVATLGAGAAHSLHAPSFNSLYFSSVTSTDWEIYDWAVNGGGNITLYGVTFGALHVMNIGPAANSFTVGGSSSVELSPTTEFLNGGTDQLFVSGLVNANPNFIENNINTFPAGILASTAEGTGTSGIAVDNDSGLSQASSVYFGVLGATAPNANSAVKLTQNGLN